MMLTLHNGAGAEAWFTEAGDLIGFQSNEQTWKLAAPQPGWAMVAATEGEQKQTFTPPVGSGTPTQQDADRVTFRFSRLIGPDGAEVQTQTKVTWWLEEGLLRGAIELAIQKPADAVWHALRFPTLSIPYAGHTQLVVPHESGWLIDHAAHSLFEAEGAPGHLEMPFQQMQFYAWIEDGRGLYTDCHDEQGWMKRWRWESDGPGRLAMHVTHLLPRREEHMSLTLPYPVWLGGFEGGWYDAAQLYRPWALERDWASRGVEQRRGQFPSQAACWVWNRGHSSRVAPPVKTLAQRIGLPVVLNWYWWHKHPYDTGYPEYFPPREGADGMRAVVEDLHQNDVTVQVYTNGMLYDMGLPTWENQGSRWCVIKEDGEYLSYIFNVFMGNRMAVLCGGVPELYPVLAANAAQVAGIGIDSLYIDMVAYSAGSMPCHHPEHGHEPGGGTYGVKGWRAKLEQLRAERPELAMTSEAMTEDYLDLFDAAIFCEISIERLKFVSEPSIHARLRPIPLFGAVYHGHIVAFGSYALLDGIPPYDDLWPVEHRPAPENEKDWRAMCPDQFAVEVARTVSFGMQPIVANLTMEQLENERFADDVDFLTRTCRFHHQHHDWLLWGRLLAPGQVDCPSRPVAFLQRFIFTPAGEETITHRNHPTVFASAWEAPDGRQGAMLINWSPEPVDVTYEPGAGSRAVACSEDALTVSGRGVRGRLPARAMAWVTLEPEAEALVTSRSSGRTHQESPG